MPLPSADQVGFMANAAFLDRMILCQSHPVFLLMLGQDSASLAKRTGVVERREDGIADEFGTVGNPPHGLGQAGIYLEGDNGFLVHGHLIPNKAHVPILLLCITWPVKGIRMVYNGRGKSMGADTFSVCSTSLIGVCF